MKQILLIVLLMIPAAPTTIVCTTTTLQVVTEQVGGSAVEVVSLVQPGVCPSHFDVRPSHLDAVDTASLVLYHGVEPWLEQLITASGNTTVEQRALKGPWNAPVLAVQKIEAVRDALIQVDPENAEYYKENAEKAIADIHTMSNTIKEEAASLEVDSIPVMCMEWQQYLVEWMGFTIVKTYSPPETLSLKDVNDLIKTGRENGVCLVIDNLQSGTEVGAEIAAAIGAEHAVLTNFPTAVPETDTLAAMIAYNADQLLTAVKKQKEQGRISELESELIREKAKKQVYQVIAAVFFVLCIVEAVVIYVRQK